MQLLSEIKVHRQGGDAVIQLLQGDLTAIPQEHEVDMLIISAFPGNYDPVPGTLVAALEDKGIVVGDMAKDKAVDLTEELGCWLSKPLSPAMQDQLHFTSLLCFEPRVQTSEQDAVVGNIFRCINSFAFDDANKVIAMPVLATGNQNVPMGKMLPAIVGAGIFWLESGLPFSCIKLVLYDDEQVKEAMPLFNTAKRNHELRPVTSVSPAPVPKSGKRILFRFARKKEPEGYDFFISYAHAHSDLVNTFVKHIQKKNRKLKIFYDKDSIPPGGLWIKQISDAIEKAKKVLVLLSPDYSNSPVCWDEFQCAKLLEYRRNSQVIQTIYLYEFKDTEMPPIMGIYSWIDCREGDEQKLRDCVSRIVE